MSIQRWSAQRIAMQWHGTDLWDDEYVTYADHVAAVAEAEQRVLDKADGYTEGYADGYVKGQQDERQRSVLLIADGYAAALDAAWEAVAQLPRPLTKTSALAAIDNLKEDK